MLPSGGRHSNVQYAETEAAHTGHFGRGERDYSPAGRILGATVVRSLPRLHGATRTQPWRQNLRSSTDRGRTRRHRRPPEPAGEDQECSHLQPQVRGALGSAVSHAEEQPSAREMAMLLPTSRATRTILGRNQRPTAKATPSNASRSPGWRYPRGAVDEGGANQGCDEDRPPGRAGLVRAVDPWQGPSSGVRGRVSWLFIAIVYIE